MPRIRLDRVRRLSAFAVIATWASSALLCGAVSAQTLSFNMTIDGGQETPPNTATATGVGTATLDTVSNLFSWNISFSGLSAAQTGAHFHGPALQCFPAGIVIALPNGSPIVGSAILTATQADQVKAGRWYVNIHSTAFPGGEIRGQVMPVPLDDPVPGPIAASTVHLQLQTLATGLVAPNWGAAAPGHPNRLFVTDQPGQLWAIDITTGTKTVFLDVSSILVPMGAFGPGTFDERGLLGVAFHPDYLSNGRLYTFTSQPATLPPDFTTLLPGQDPDCQTVITEWTVPNPADPSSVPDPLSARDLLRIDKPQFNHNGGAINFGPDGMLYIALGDGGAGDDQGVGHSCGSNGQDLANPLGKILRIDPLGNNSANGEYGIPGDNPFIATPGAVDEIYVYGLRNPFRFSFDSLTGELYLGDVGQNDIEEVHIVKSGDNCGWNHKEGSFFFVRNGALAGYVTDQPLAGPTGLLEPIAEYDHDEGISVIGGFVYRGTRLAPLSGRYVFGEFAKTFDLDGRLFHLDESNAIREFQLVGQAGVNLFILGTGQDADGELYLMANGTGVPFESTGVVLRITRKPGDVNLDGTTNITDLLALIGGWGACPPPPTPCPGDMNDDGQVNVIDLLALIAGWG
ncbi:MAG: PQQ-dependent sugar dehydrogenase [Phycisphaerales bacterium]|nr:PQQ-dependent sugar dehydrogenase [Phycisphaerales bacterium]